MEESNRPLPSCPDLIRASMRFRPATSVSTRVDGRVEPGHDVIG